MRAKPTANHGGTAKATSGQGGDGRLSPHRARRRSQADGEGGCADAPAQRRLNLQREIAGDAGPRRDRGAQSGQRSPKSAARRLTLARPGTRRGKSPGLSSALGRNVEISDARRRHPLRPSPTGYLHIGGARTALFNLLVRTPYGRKLPAARRGHRPRPLHRAGGEGHLRRPGLAGAVEPTKTPVFSSSRAERHREAATSCWSTGHAYRAT